MIRKSEEPLEQLIPLGCSYGVYDSEGVWLEGQFSLQEQADAWEKYKEDSIYAGDGGYYRFILMDDGKVCIVKYDLVMRYSAEKLNSLLPAPEILMPIIVFILFILDVIFLSKSFAGKLKVQLKELSGITEKIAENDLEFQTKPSDIKEINEVMVSLGQMKDALQASLRKQWDMELQRSEQLSALAHDIKTPLTIIRGNAELLGEGNLSDEDKESAAYILSNVKEIEQQLSLAEKVPVSFDVKSIEGEICGVRENIARAWSNMVSNALEHTDRQRGIKISIKQSRKKKIKIKVPIMFQTVMDGVNYGK